MKWLLYLLALVYLSLLTPIQAETVKILPLGDSITWGYYFGDNRTEAYRHSYRNYLWYKLKAADYDVDFVGSQKNGQAIRPIFDGDHDGHYGYTTNQIRDIISDRLTRYRPDIILLHIGTNDPFYNFNTSATRVESILDEIDRFEQAQHMKITVILAQIINLRKYPSWVDQYNSNLRSMAQRRIENGDDLVLVNMQSAVGWNLADGVHPNNTGYQQMATIWFNALKKPIEDRNNYAFLIPIYHTILNE